MNIVGILILTGLAVGASGMLISLGRGFYKCIWGGFKVEQSNAVSAGVLAGLRAAAPANRRQNPGAPGGTPLRSAGQASPLQGVAILTSRLRARTVKG